MAPRTMGPQPSWRVVPQSEAPRQACCRQQQPCPSSDLGAAWGCPAEVAAAAAATSGSGEVRLGAQGRAEPRRLLSDGRAAFEGCRGPGFHSRWLPLSLDGQEGGQVEVQRGHPSAGRGRALAALWAGDPALLVGWRVQPPHARLAEGVAAVEAAGQVPSEVVGRVADDAVSPPGPSSCPLLGGLGTLWPQHPGGGTQGSSSPAHLPL